MSDSCRTKLGYDDPLELYLSRLEAIIQGDYGLSRRSLALLLLQQDKEFMARIKEGEGERWDRILGIINEASAHYRQPLAYIINVCRQREASRIAAVAATFNPTGQSALRLFLSRLLMNPFTGGPILLAILYYGLYKFVGVFGAGVMVGFLEKKVFDGIINPWAAGIVHAFIPFKLLQDLLVGEYGVVTLGMRYALAIILPIVATFFFAFAIVEDTGYLPRLAMLVDRLFKKIGLSGRAVIPLVLGLGCSTMATLVTRTLPTKRERIIATLLLSLAIPCSAQMGVILGLLSEHPAGLFCWLGVIIAVFMLVGFLSSRIMPGELPSFYMEIPPLRLPQLSNVLSKTVSRLKWYILEIIPLFMAASLIIWLGKITGLFSAAVKLLAVPVAWLGLPPQTAVAFLFGFLRRDYGAAGLYDLKTAGLLSGNQMVVACVTLTLFLPCIAQLLMNVRERGLRMGIAMSVFILFFSFGVGYLVNIVLRTLGMQL